MRYLLLIYDDQETIGAMTRESGQAMMREYSDYTQWLQDEGLLQAGDALQPASTATTVRLRDGEQLITDGPFAETKEVLGGYYLIECDNLDRAIEAAGRIPSARTGSIEIRPVMEFAAEQAG